MKTPEQIRDELAFVIANSSADAYVTKTDEHGIRRTEFDAGIIAQAVINHLAADMNEVREASTRDKMSRLYCLPRLVAVLAYAMYEAAIRQVQTHLSCGHETQ
jgi:hypothetical protein